MLKLLFVTHSGSLNAAEVKLIDFGSACMENRTVYSYIQVPGVCCLTVSIFLIVLSDTFCSWARPFRILGRSLIITSTDFSTLDFSCRAVFIVPLKSC